MGDVWDWIEENIVDPVVGIFQDVIDYVAEKVGEFVSYIVIHVIDALGYVIPGLDEVLYELAEILYDVWEEVGEYLTPVIQAFAAYYGVPYQISGGMIDSFETMLEEIHYEELKRVSDIEKEVTEEWWLALGEIEKEAERISRQSGLGPGFVSLILRITRNKVLEVSNLLGRPYLLAELEWVGQLHKILIFLNTRPYPFTTDMTSLYRFIDEVIYEPYCDTKGTLALSWFAMFDGLLKASRGLDDSIMLVLRDLRWLTQNVGKQIKEIAGDGDDKLRGEISQWRNAVYFPKINSIEELLDVLSGRSNKNTRRVESIIERLLSPAGYLEEIDDTDPDKRADQEDRVTDISHRRYARDSDALSQEASDTYEHLDDLVDAGQIPVEVKPWKQPAVADIKPKRVEPTRKCKTWFRGDY